MVPACAPPRTASRPKALPDEAARTRILATNPAQLYGFPP